MPKYTGSQYTAAKKSGQTTKTNNSTSSSSKTSSNSSKSSSSKTISDYLNENIGGNGKYYTTVTEKDGSTSIGYIKDGVSYYGNDKPINAGASVVDSTGKTWTKGDNSINAYLSQNGVNANERYTPNYGDLSTESVAYNPYEEAYKESQRRYEELEAQIREKNRLAVEQGTNRLNAQKSNINQSADENARQAYVQFMQSQKALPQQLASQGVSGGATETANLGLQTAYQNNVNAINQNKANRLQEIDNAIVDLQNTGDLSTVEQVLANNQAALDAYMNTFDKGVGYNQWANQFNANRQETLADQAYRDQVYADQMAQQQLENQWYERNYSDSKKQEETNTVINLLENGLVDTNHASTLLGVPVEQLNNFVNYINKARNLELSNTQSLISNRNSSGGSGSGTEKATSASTINSIINTANKMLNEREDVFGDGSIYRNVYDDNAVKNYILSQNITDREQYDILSGLGLI